MCSHNLCTTWDQKNSIAANQHLANSGANRFRGILPILFIGKPCPRPREWKGRSGRHAPSGLSHGYLLTDDLDGENDDQSPVSEGGCTDHDLFAVAKVEGRLHLSAIVQRV